MKKEIQMRVISLKRLELPEEFEEKIYTMILNVQKLSAGIENWKQVNPRDPKSTSPVSRDIRETLEEAPSKFLFRNRGLTILVEKLFFDNKKNEVMLHMSDPKIHGLLDGGHTYKIVMDFIKENPEVKDAFIKIEVIEGIKNNEDVIDLVESRNTSKQVELMSILNLNKSFNNIQIAIGNKDYSDKIYYKEYEEYTSGEMSGKKKEVSVRDIVACLTCFDVEKFGFDDSVQPVIAYSSKNKSLEHFQGNKERMDCYTQKLPKILELWDTIQSEFPSVVASHNARMALLEGVKKKKTRLHFLEIDSEYKIPSGYIFPIFAAFRDLISIREGKCSFEKDPIEVFQKLKKYLIGKVLEKARELKSPNKVGKDRDLWELCASKVHYEK